MKKMNINYVLLFIVAILTVVCSIWGPEALTAYKDKSVLNKVNTQTIETEGEGYQYQISTKDRLYILSQCLNSQTLPESEQNALTRVEETDYQELEGTYAFVINHQGPSGREITDEEIYENCNQMIADLKELDILPASVQEISASGYDAILYSAIDILEPRNNVSVWKVSLSTSQKTANKENRLLDAYLDADTGKVYEFYVRTERKWEEIDPDEIIEKWSSYLGIGAPEAYETDNPLLEATPYYRKYVIKGNSDEATIVTVGFYEGINELFLKVSR